MCIAIPMQVISARGLNAVCRNGLAREEVTTELTGAVSPGEWILVFQGGAVRRMDEEEALSMRTALSALSSVMEGTATDSQIEDAFSDITAHTGELPPYLKTESSASVA